MNNKPLSISFISPRTRPIIKKPQLRLESYLRKGLQASGNTRKKIKKGLQRTGRGKVRSGLSTSNGLAFDMSNENIVKTPSSTNEHPPDNLELLNDSLNNYYENEVNRVSTNNCVTPIPFSYNWPSRVTERKRSNTPKLRYDKLDNYLPILKKNQEKKEEKARSPPRRIMQAVTRIRYYSRKERNSRSPESKKGVYYYFN